MLMICAGHPLLSGMPQDALTEWAHRQLGTLARFNETSLKNGSALLDHHDPNLIYWQILKFEPLLQTSTTGPLYM